MKYKALLFLIGFSLLDILIFPADKLSPYKVVRGQTDGSGELSEEDRKTDDQIINLQNDIDIVDLVNAVSEIKQEIYMIDGSVKPRDISIITPEGGMNREDMLMFFDTILRLNGLAVVKSDGVNKIVNSKDIGSQNTPFITDQKN